MKNVEIRLKDDRAEWFPGETLEGTVRWSLDAMPESIELRLFWYTRGKGSEDVRMAERKSLAAGSLEDEQLFSLPLPLEPYSFSGKLIALIWAVECVALPGKETARAEFTLSHLGAAIELGSAAEVSDAQVPSVVRKWLGSRKEGHP